MRRITGPSQSSKDGSAYRPARANMALLPYLRHHTPHTTGIERTLVRRKPAEPHLEDGGIYRKRWWAYFDGRQNHLRDVAGQPVSLPKPSA